MVLTFLSPESSYLVPAKKSLIHDDSNNLAMGPFQRVELRQGACSTQGSTVGLARAQWVVSSKVVQTYRQPGASKVQWLPGLVQEFIGCHLPQRTPADNKGGSDPWKRTWSAQCVGRVMWLAKFRCEAYKDFICNHIGVLRTGPYYLVNFPSFLFQSWTRVGLLWNLTPKAIFLF